MGSLYAVLINYPSIDLSEHINEVVAIVSPHLYFLYVKKEYLDLQHAADNVDRHAQDLDGFVYSILLWRSIDKHIRQRGI